MNIAQASWEQLETVKSITASTIKEIYPLYYPKGAVAFFISHHHEDTILKNIQSGFVFLLYNHEQEAVGTITVRGNEICRLFVLPQHQSKGYGRALLDFAEKKIAEHSVLCVLDASLPAKAIYFKRGYREVEPHSIQTACGDFLCYDVMQKRLGGHD